MRVDQAGVARWTGRARSRLHAFATARPGAGRLVAVQSSGRWSWRRAPRSRQPQGRCDRRENTRASRRSARRRAPSGGEADRHCRSPRSARSRAARPGARSLRWRGRRRSWRRRRGRTSRTTTRRRRRLTGHDHRRRSGPPNLQRDLAGQCFVSRGIDADPICAGRQRQPRVEEHADGLRRAAQARRRVEAHGADGVGRCRDPPRREFERHWPRRGIVSAERRRLDPRFDRERRHRSDRRRLPARARPPRCRRRRR